MAFDIPGRREGVVVAKQLVGAVDEINVQRQTPQNDYKSSALVTLPRPLVIASDRALRDNFFEFGSAQPLFPASVP